MTKPSITVAIDSAVATMMSGAHNAIATGFSPTARTLVRTRCAGRCRGRAAAAPTRRWRRRPARRPAPPSTSHSGNRFALRDDTWRRKLSASGDRRGRRTARPAPPRRHPQRARDAEPQAEPHQRPRAAPPRVIASRSMSPLAALQQPAHLVEPGREDRRHQHEPRESAGQQRQRTQRDAAMIRARRRPRASRGPGSRRARARGRASRAPASAAAAPAARGAPAAASGRRRAGREAGKASVGSGGGTIGHSRARRARCPPGARRRRSAPRE